MLTGISTDPFADDVGDTPAKNYVHIRIQRKWRSSHAPILGVRLAQANTTTERNGRKTLTTVQGLSKDYSPKALLKAFKKEYGTAPLFSCNILIVIFTNWP